MAPDARLEETARRFHQHQADEPLDVLAELIHEDARMTLLVNRLRPVEGRDAIIAAVGEGRDALLYSARVDSCEWAADGIVLLHGQARYVTDGGGTTVAQVWWVDEFRDGLLWRAEAFTSESAAREASGGKAAIATD